MKRARHTTYGEYQCLQCEKTFIRTKPWQHFCSGKCRDDFHNAYRRVAIEEFEKAHGPKKTNFP